MKPSGFSHHQSGASLIEVLVAVLILSIGLLAMGAMMSYATLLPKFSGNRSVAISTATNMIERMRANPSNPTASPAFSISTRSTIATSDIAEIQFQLDQQLTPAGMTIQVTDAANNEGNLWIIWQEPSTFGTFSTSGSDNCPAAIVALSLTPPPRCVYLPFKL